MKINYRSVQAVIFSLIILILCCSNFLSCKKDSTKVAQKRASTGKFDLDNSLINNIPPDTLAFFEWDSSTDAYKKYANSPWVGQQQVSFDKFLTEQDDIKNYIEVLNKAGIDLTKRTTWSSIFSRSVFYLSPSEGVEKLTAALYFQSNKDIKLDELLTTLKEAYKAEQGSQVQDITIDGGKGFSVKHQGDDDLFNTIYLGWKGQKGVFASNHEAANNVLGGKYNSLPEIVKSSDFQKNTKDFPSSKSRLAFAYGDIIKVLERLPEDKQGVKLEKIEFSSLPIKSMSWASSMTDVPNHFFRATYNPSDSEQKEWFDALGVSGSNSLLPAVPTNTLLFLSIDGQSLNRLKELALKQQNQDITPDIREYLGLLDNLNRLGILLRVGVPGQSILPIPDIMFVLDTSKPDDTLAKTSSIIQNIAQGAGGVQTGWTEEKIDENTVKSIMTPMGIGGFLTKIDSLVILSSTKQQIQDVLGILSGSTPSSEKTTLPNNIHQALREHKTLSDVYVNFREVGSLIENMGGLLSMYAPQNQQAQSFMQQKNIDNLKQMGHMLGAITVEDNTIGFNSFYQIDASKKS
jgi:hypothetical protein